MFCLFSSISLLVIPVICSQKWEVKYSNMKKCALKGSTIHLSGTYKHPSDVTVTEKFWTVNPSTEKSINLMNHSDYRDRVQFFQNKEGMFFLSLSNVTHGDEGMYCLRILTGVKKQRFLGFPGIVLNVIELRVEIPAEIMEGESPVLFCKTTCDLSGKTNFTWYKNGKRLSERIVSDQLLLPSVSSDDTGNYSCAVRDQKHLSSPAVTLSVRYPPKSVSVSISPSGVIVEGDSVTLSCSSDSNPPAKINWFKGRTFVGSGRIYNISKISSDHRGEYKCKSTNEHGEKYSDVVTLNIMYPPRNVSVSINGSGVIVEGDSVTLICSSDSNPPALNFSWFKGGTSVGSGKIYSISKISSDHSEEYKCRSINEHGEKYSEAVTLNVMYPPKNVSVSINGCGVIVEGDSVTLSCSSDSNPPALNFSWFKENQSSAVGSGQSFSALQSGRFYCEAHNQHGSQRSDAVTVTVHGRKYLYAVAGVTGGLGGFIFIFIIVLLMKKKHRPDPITQKQDDVYVNVSAHDEPLSESDPASQNDALYSLITLSNISHNQTEEKVSDSEDTEEIQYVTVLYHRNKESNQPEENESQYDNIRKYQPDAAMRSGQQVEDQSVIYSTVK